MIAAAVSVERHDNVIYLVTRPEIPARWSPRPLRIARRRFARSQLAAELSADRDLIAVLVGLLAAGLLCIHTPLPELAHTLAGVLP